MNAGVKLSGNQINPSKLLLSKWTAAIPQNKERHFLVTEIIKNEQELIIACQLEALLTGNSREIDWRLLKNKTEWLPGWR